MKKGSDVFHLIKTLSKGEKRYFKLFSKLHVKGEKNKYVKLFETLDKEKKDIHKKNSNKLSKQGIGRFYSAEKNYLYHNLLNVLNIYHSESSIENNLNGMLRSADVLYSKSLYSHSYKEIMKAKKVAYLYDKFEDLLKILKKQREIIERITPTANEIQKISKTLFEEESEVIGLLINQIKLRQIYDRLFILSKKFGITRKDSERKEARNIYSNPLLKNESTALCYDSKRYFYNANMYYYYLINDISKSHGFRKKLVKLMEEHPHRINENPVIYKSALGSLMLTCNQLEKEEELFFNLKKMRDIPKYLNRTNSRQLLEVMIFESSYINETDFYLRTGKIEKGIEVVSRVERELDKYKGRMEQSSEITLYLNIMCLFFNADRFHEALIWNNRIINMQSSNMRQDLISFSYIINLIIHFELNNQMELPYYLKSTYRYLIKHERVNKFEQIILNHLKKILILKTKNDLLSLFISMNNELMPLKSDPVENIMFIDIDITKWLQKKIKKGIK